MHCPEIGPREEQISHTPALGLASEACGKRIKNGTERAMVTKDRSEGA